MAEKRTTTELIELQEAKIEVDLKKLAELKARLKTEHPDSEKLRKELQCELGAVIEKHLGRELTRQDCFRIEKYLEYRDERGNYFTDWMNRPINTKEKRGTKEDD